MTMPSDRPIAVGSRMGGRSDCWGGGGGGLDEATGGFAGGGSAGLGGRYGSPTTPELSSPPPAVTARSVAHWSETWKSRAPLDAFELLDPLTRGWVNLPEFRHSDALF